MNVLYREWMANTPKESLIHKELEELADDPEAIEDRFYRELEFGTGGLRGVLGAGTNRMNEYTVGRATFGLAAYLCAKYKDPSVVIAYDSRHRSEEFAMLIAQILSSCGIVAYIFQKLTPTPVLSYAVRSLKTSAGIVITASHNPKEYNGYKVYNDRGCQITDSAAKEIMSEIEKNGYFRSFTADASLIRVLDDAILNRFLDEISKYSLFAECEKFCPGIVYTPLHGTGNMPVRSILKRIGVKKLTVVKEQELPDGDFTTCPYPNPEEKAALQLALGYAKETQADLVLATDPDADRVGIAVRTDEGYKLFNGNETGVVLENYILSRRAEKGGTVIKTIVTTDMATAIAQSYGAKVKEVLTGFKYIGEELDKTPDFVMGMEESYGYLVGSHARDKDAVSAAMMIVEACAFYASQGKSLDDVLEELYEKFGYYRTSLLTKTYYGKSGKEEMDAIVKKLRENPPAEICGEKTEKCVDYAAGVDGLPKSNVLSFWGSSFKLVIRPSGTEPKLKAYIQIKKQTKEASDEFLQRMEEFVKSMI